MNNLETEISFVDQILDNVHGFIPYTEAERKIMESQIFKRTQNIKQLSLVNWVFPGSEHTRFIHSLGVMHIADKIAIQLELTNKERRVLRMAGLLHDIGHYPLSHVCEVPYKDRMQIFETNAFCKSINKEVYESINGMYADINNIEGYMKKAKAYHHEDIGKRVIESSDEIRKIIEEEFGEDAENVKDMICDIITGNVERDFSKSGCDIYLLVQIMHSEIDADGIDYMMRDAMFSGTSFGSFEVDQLIRCMKKVKYDNVNILCLEPKGIAAADQYLINKFFSFSQIVFNKHTVVLEWMAEQIVSWLQEFNFSFPKKETLAKEWIKESSDMQKFIDFTDNFFWQSLSEIINNKARETFPKYIIELCRGLLYHKELTFIQDSEYKIISNDIEEIKEFLQESDVYKKKGEITNTITILCQKAISKHIPIGEFEKKWDKIIEEAKENNIQEYDTIVESKDKQKLNRFLEGTCIVEDNDIRLLCDDKRSLMRQLYNTRLVVMRSYKFNEE